MLIQMSNFPDGETVIAQVTEEQADLLEWLKEHGALIPDFVFEEIDITYLS